MIKRILLLTILYCSLNIYTYAQEKDVLGIGSPTDVDRLMLFVPDVGRENGSRDMLMYQNVKPFMMPPRNLGEKGDILSYTIATCMEYYINLETNYKINLSPDFIDLSLQHGKGANTLEKALKFVSSTGTVSASVLPFGTDEISESVFAAKKYKLRNFLYVISPNTRNHQKIFEIRKALIKGNPVLGELKVDTAFEALKFEDYWKPNFSKKDEGIVQPIIIVGYDKEKEACEILYCKGTTWGNYGYAWVKFDILSKYLQNGYVMIPE